MATNYKIDKVDREILNALMKNALTPYSVIARKLILSPGTIHVRMKKLTKMGIVKGSQVIIDEGKFGYDICAFMGIHLQKGSEYQDTVSRMKNISEIVELYYTTGSYSMFAKIVCHNTEHLRKVLVDKIQPIKGIQRTETFISLEQSIKRQVKVD